MPQDALLLLRDGTTNLTTTGNGTGVDFGGADQQPITYEMDIPTVTGTTPILVMKIQVSGDNSNWIDFLTYGPGGAAPATNNITVAGVYFVTGKTRYRYRRFAATVSGTTPVFGNCLVAAVAAGLYDNF